MTSLPWRVVTTVGLEIVLTIRFSRSIDRSTYGDNQSNPLIVTVTMGSINMIPRMKPDLYPDKISYADFEKYLGHYKDHAPKKIQGLEELRYNEIPEIVAKRKQDGEAFLEKTEVQSLADWKLYVISSTVFLQLRSTAYRY